MGLGKAKGKLEKRVESAYNSAPGIQETQERGQARLPRDQRSEIRSQGSETDRFRPLLLASEF